MIHFSNIIVALAFTAYGTNPVHAQQSQSNANPGNTGANAFSFVTPVTDASISEKIIIDLKVRGGQDNLGRTQAGIFRIEVPFSTWVSISAEMLAEHYKISESALNQFPDITKPKGYAGGDFNIFTKIRVLQENHKNYCPAVSILITTKTASGDFAKAHRFTDSAGYSFSALISKDIPDSDYLFFEKIRFLFEAGFIAWDTNEHEQNDAFKIAAGVVAIKNNYSFKINFLNYTGWQDTDNDYVSMANFEAQKQVNSRLNVFVNSQIRLSKAAPPAIFGAGIRCYFNRPKALN